MIKTITNSGQLKTISSDCVKVPEWVEMIFDLRNGAGYSYTKIASYIGVSPAAIQRIATGKRNEPKFRVSIALLKLYYESFYGTKATNYAVSYIRLKKEHRLDWTKQGDTYFKKILYL